MRQCIISAGSMLVGRVCTHSAGHCSEHHQLLFFTVNFTLKQTAVQYQGLEKLQGDAQPCKWIEMMLFQPREKEH